MSTERRYWRYQCSIENEKLGKRKIDDSFIATSIEYLSGFDLVVEGNMKEIC